MKRFLFLVGLLLSLATPNLAQTKTDTLYFEFDIDPNADSHEFVYQFSDEVRAGIEVEYHDGKNQGRFKAEAGEQRMTVYGKGYWRIYCTYEQPFGYSTMITTREDFRTDIEIHEYGVYLTSLDVSHSFALISLVCSYNQLTSLDVSHNTVLGSLLCSDNQLTSLDVSQNTALTSLYCYNNQLTNLDVSHNTALESLWCSDNPLTSLDVSHNSALTYLGCHTNQLTSLDVSHNTALTRLDCPNNQLTSLDVSHNTALTDLRCDNNPLTSLDISHNPALTVLGCGNNQLTSLDVSQNTALTVLGCGNNQLTSLDVSHNTALTDLRCDNNPLTSLDVSNNTALERLSCSNNHIPLSTLYDIYNQTSNWSYFYAGRQRDLIKLPINQVLDLSSEMMLGETLSTFTLYPDSYTEEDFVFRFHKLAEYKLTLQNSAIPTASITYSISVEWPDNYFTVQVASGNSKWGTATIEGDGFYIEDASFYEKDSLVTITATPNEGYRFVNWTKQDGRVFSTEAVHTFAVTENLELTANFAVENFTVNLFANNPEWGYVFRTGNNYKYEEGDKLTILALPAEGYRFVNWTNGGSEFSKEALFTFAVTENLELTANFALGDVANENRQDDNDNLRVYTQDHTIHLSENRGMV